MTMSIRSMPVWVPLPYASEWPWLMHREDSPWYPTMRLFRQAEFGNWAGVFERIRTALEEKLAAGPRAVQVGISPGELFDKITILESKSERVTDSAELARVRAELGALTAARDRAVRMSAELEHLRAELKAVNQALWEIKDDLRSCEQAGEFGPRFVELARSVSRTNDRRHALKSRINELSAGL